VLGRPSLAAACIGVLLSTALAGCSDLAQLEDAVDLAHSGGTHEVNVELGDGDLVTWDWTAGSAIDFNVHTHQGRDVVVHFDVNNPAHGGQWVAGSAGTYSLQWTNPGNMTVHLEYDLHTDGKFV